MISFLVGTFLAKVALGGVIATSLLFSAFLYMLVTGRTEWTVLALKMLTGLDSFPLLAVPFFVLAGWRLNSAWLTHGLANLSAALVGRLRGGLAHVDVVTGMLMAGVSGSASADAAALTSIFTPAMERDGYPRPFGAALSACSGAIGPIIPPSIFFVVYGALGNVSVGRLFLGGAVPGVMMGIGLMAYTYVVARRRGYGALTERIGGREFLVRLERAAFPLTIPVIIIGGIVGGVVTPTEAGVLAVVAILVIGLLVTRRLSAAQCLASLKSTVRILGAVMFICSAANIFAWILGIERMGEHLSGYLHALTSSPAVMLLIINLILLVLGCLLDAMAMLIVLTPILVPVMVSLGIDPVHFGVIFVLNLTIGLLTPPYGVVMFISSAVAKVTIKEFVVEAWPMILVLVGVLFMAVYMPSLVLFVPNLLMP
jgi:tripartite ATP-independent transporter DctM subunit